MPTKSGSLGGDQSGDIFSRGNPSPEKWTKLVTTQLVQKEKKWKWIGHLVTSQGFIHLFSKFYLCNQLSPGFTGFQMGKFSPEHSFHLKDGALETIHFFSGFRPGKKFGGGPRIVTNHHFHLKYAFLSIQTIFTHHTHFHLNSAIVKEQNCGKSRITWGCTIWVNWQLRSVKILEEQNPCKRGGIAAVFSMIWEHVDTPSQKSSLENEPFFPLESELKIQTEMIFTEFLSRDLALIQLRLGFFGKERFGTEIFGTSCFVVKIRD